MHFPVMYIISPGKWARMSIEIFLRLGSRSDPIVRDSDEKNVYKNGFSFSTFLFFSTMFCKGINLGRRKPPL